MPVVDIHTHFFPKSWPKFPGPDWPWLRHSGPGEAVVMLGDREFRRITVSCWDAAIRLEEMDRDGVDIQVMCATPVLFAYDRPAALARDWAAYFNDAALEICNANPRRLKAMCQVPLQDVDLACKELSRAMAAGHVGVHIGNHVGHRDLNDDGLITFLQHCAAEGASVLVHPWDMMARERMRSYMLPWLVGMPAETHLSILWLILSGGFERLPRSLKICFAHGGGSFAFLIGRIDSAWINYHSVRADCPSLPSSYTDRFYVDSAVFSYESLSLLVKVMGENRVMLGSDYPFPLGEKEVGRLIRTHDAMTEQVRSKLLGENALSFFGIRGAAEAPIRGAIAGQA